MNSAAPLARSPAEATPSWLTAVLRANGYACQIDEVTRQSIGTGQVGENVRFTLQGQGDYPKTLVGKFPSTDPVSRQAGIAQLTYQREAGFYQAWQARVAIQTPRIFHVAIDKRTQDFDLLMEDLAPGQQGNQLEGCALPQAELAFQQLAGLHGPFWGKEIVADESVTRADSPDAGTNLQAVYQALAPGFLARYADQLTEQEKTLAQQLGDQLHLYPPAAATIPPPPPCPLTLVHGDYRLDNMIFGGPYPLTVLDWQTLAVGQGPSDAAYFAGTSLEPKARRQHEERLLRLYHKTLQPYGVNLPWETCHHLYRRYAPAGLIMAVIASMIVGETPRGNQMFLAMAHRSAQMTQDLDSLDLLQ